MSNSTFNKCFAFFKLFIKFKLKVVFAKTPPILPLLFTVLLIFEGSVLSSSTLPKAKPEETYLFHMFSDVLKDLGVDVINFTNEMDESSVARFKTIVKEF